MTRRISLALFLAGSLINISLRAVDFGDTLLPKQQERELVRPAATRPADGNVGDDEILLESLDGVVIGREESATLALQESSPAGVSFSGIDEKSARSLAAAVRPYLDKGVSLNQLDRLARDLEKSWQHITGQLVSASFPPQEITGGVISVVITERRAGEVKVQGKPVFGGEFIRQNFRTRKGDLLSSRSITEDLAWINENPYRRVDLTYTDSEDEASSDLVLAVTERNPFRLYAGYDNYSNARVGGNRLFSGFGWGNVWGLDHRLAYQYTTDTDFDRLTGQSLVYEAPLPWRHTLSLNATLSSADADLGGSQELNGDFREIEVSYQIPLPSFRDIRHQLQFGFEYQENSYELATATGGSIENFVRFFVLTAGYQAKIPDSLGFTVVDIGVRMSPGDGFLGIDDTEYQRLSGDSDSHYWIGRLRVDRTWWLPANSNLFTRLEGQWADSPLLATERFSASGAYDVRGYDESDAFADNVFRFTAEWRAPSFSLLGTKLGENAKDRVQPYLFWDYAYLHNIGTTNDEHLSSVGVGTKYQIGQNFSLRADLGIPLTNLRGESQGPRVHLSAFITF